MDALRQFFGGYFHQDGVLDSPSWEGVVRRYVQSEPPETQADALDQLDSLIAEHNSDLGLGNELLRELGCYFEPRSEGLTPSEWLKRVRACLADAQ